MTPPRKATASTSTSTKDKALAQGLRDLGLTEYEIRVFLAILRHPLSRVPEIAKHSGVPQPKVYATVKRLIARGLCESHLGPVNTYSAIPPEVGFAPLVEELGKKHVGAQDVVQRLEKEHGASADSLAAREGRIKLFQGRQASSRNFHELLSRVEREVLLIAKIPFVVSDDDALLAAALERGASVRILLGIPDDFDLEAEPLLDRQLALGCESRRTAQVPMRLGIFDRRVALMPIKDAQAGEDVLMMLEVRNEGLAQGLANVFEMLWELATPIE